MCRLCVNALGKSVHTLMINQDIFKWHNDIKFCDIIEHSHYNIFRFHGTSTVAYSERRYKNY